MLIRLTMLFFPVLLSLDVDCHCVARSELVTPSVVWPLALVDEALAGVGQPMLRWARF